MTLFTVHYIYFAIHRYSNRNCVLLNFSNDTSVFKRSVNKARLNFLVLCFCGPCGLNKVRDSSTKPKQ